MIITVIFSWSLFFYQKRRKVKGNKKKGKNPVMAYQFPFDFPLTTVLSLCMCISFCFGLSRERQFVSMLQPFPSCYVSAQNVINSPLNASKGEEEARNMCSKWPLMAERKSTFSRGKRCTRRGANQFLACGLFSFLYTSCLFPPKRGQRKLFY